MVVRPRLRGYGNHAIPKLPGPDNHAISKYLGLAITLDQIGGSDKSKAPDPRYLGLATIPYPRALGLSWFPSPSIWVKNKIKKY
jgi:hypothetical protein